MADIDHGDACETVFVRTKAVDGNPDGVMRINKKDFDEDQKGEKKYKEVSESQQEKIEEKMEQREQGSAGKDRATASPGSPAEAKIAHPPGSASGKK